MPKVDRLRKLDKKPTFLLIGCTQYHVGTWSSTAMNTFNPRLPRRLSGLRTHHDLSMYSINRSVCGLILRWPYWSVIVNWPAMHEFRLTHVSLFRKYITVTTKFGRPLSLHGFRVRIATCHGYCPLTLFRRLYRKETSFSPAKAWCAFEQHKGIDQQWGLMVPGISSCQCQGC